jgi:parvulin-like peptidyl-prolyl isomerase
MPATPIAAAPPVSSAAATAAPLDPAVRGASGEPTAVHSTIPSRSVFEDGRIAARVGDEVITLQELTVAVKRRRKSIPGQITNQEAQMLFRSVLNELIERAIVVQEAKRELKNAKSMQVFTKQADEVWTAEELPPLLRQTASANIYELRQKLSERGESLDDEREDFRQTFLYQGYLAHKLGPKFNVELPEMKAYYLEHLKDFDQPATVTWREVVIEVGRKTDRASARRKAEAVLARLRRGEDFAAVAKAESDGPNKADGGLWQTSPGGYAVPEVNAALGSLRAGELGGVIEGRTSFHVVRVEGRRAAGPATFAEVQDKVRRAIRDQKVKRVSSAYLEKLRGRTIVTTLFDAPASPGVTRTSAELPARSRSSAPGRPAPTR